MVQVGDWVRLHEDAYQAYPGDRIPAEMLLKVTEVTGYGAYATIRIKPPFEGATTWYCNWEYDIVEPKAN